MGRRKKAYDYIDALKKLNNAGLSNSIPPNADRANLNDEQLPSLEERVAKLFYLSNNSKRSISNMLFFVMYDIESNKVRRYIVKYLERKGCTRIQKSIFLADLSVEDFNEIKKDLTEVQAAYENNDSILVVPITPEYLRSMRIIGQNINIDIITHTRNTIFF